MGGKHYQQEAQEVVDYQLHQVDGSTEWFRGPRHQLYAGCYVTFLGAAQTFGTFVRNPFPTILGERLAFPILNLGTGGAGPGRFLQDKSLLDHANRGACTVVQVMSGRSAENSEYEALGNSSVMRRRGSNDSYEAAERLWPKIFAERSVADIDRLIAETRADWLSKMSALLGAISTTKILVWISKRSPTTYPDTHMEAIKTFPHFVSPTMVDELKASVDAFVDGTSSRGSPQRLSNRFTGFPTSIQRPAGTVSFNSSYPSPEMHEDIANALFPVLKDMLPKPWQLEQRLKAAQSESAQ